MSLHVTAVPDMSESGTVVHDPPLLLEYSRNSPVINGAESVALMVRPLPSAVMKSLSLIPESLEIESIEMVVEEPGLGMEQGPVKGLGSALGSVLGSVTAQGGGVDNDGLVAGGELLPSRAGSVRVALLPAARWWRR